MIIDQLLIERTLKLKGIKISNCHCGLRFSNCYVIDRINGLKIKIAIMFMITSRLVRGKLKYCGSIVMHCCLPL